MLAGRFNGQNIKHRNCSHPRFTRLSHAFYTALFQITVLDGFNLGIVGWGATACSPRVLFTCSSRASTCPLREICQTIFSGDLRLEVYECDVQSSLLPTLLICSSSPGISKIKESKKKRPLKATSISKYPDIGIRQRQGLFSLDI